jgi:hypothetical protein
MIRRYPMMTSLLQSLLFGALAAQSQETSPPPLGHPAARQSAAIASEFRITGTLVDIVTGEPLAHCRLMATLIPPVGTNRGGNEGGSSASTDSVQSDATGQFTLLVPSAGAWRLTGSGRGYRSQSFEQHDGYSSAVVLTNSSPSFHLTFRLVPDAEIEGTVLDEAGEPIRDASVTLLASRPADSDLPQRPPQRRGTTLTDDRGHYDFSDLGPGDYMISLHARPWYATAGTMSGDPTDSKPNPLDVLYLPMWYPGVTDFSAATPLSLQPGDHREADFHPIPQQSFHLRIAAPSSANRVNGVPNVTELSPDGTERTVQTEIQRDDQGNWNISGLAPGSYEVHTSRAANGTTGTSLIDVSASSPRIVDLNSASPLSIVTIGVDAPENPPGLQVNLINLASGHSSTVQVSTASPGSSLRNQSTPVSSDPSADNATGGIGAPDPNHTVQLQPGDYEVVLNAAGDHYLSGIIGSGGESTGRIVHLNVGPAHLVLRIAAGRASLSGIAKLHDQPVVAATVLLVPATLGDSRGMTTMRRDQSNTDGSFNLDSVLPGAYILIAIDHGWTINWRDLTTLRRFLTGGIAVDIAPGAALRRNVEVQKP